MEKVKRMENAWVEFARCYDNLIGMRYFKEKPIKGTFLRFGDTVQYHDEKYFSQTVALVLGEDQQVYSVPPDAIKLLE